MYTQHIDAQFAGHEKKELAALNNDKPKNG